MVRIAISVESFAAIARTLPGWQRGLRGRGQRTQRAHLMRARRPAAGCLAPKGRLKMNPRTIDPLQPRTRYAKEELRQELKRLLKMSDEEQLMEAIVNTFADAIKEATALERSKWEPLQKLLEAAHSLIAVTLPKPLPRTSDPLQPPKRYTKEELRREVKYLLKMSDGEQLMEAIADTFDDAIREAKPLERRKPFHKRIAGEWEPLQKLLEAARDLIAFTLPQLPSPKE
jgi:hypothetical protein